jgi:hypothetical protein
MIDKVQVKFDAFFDMGFDPRFSKNGDYFFPNHGWKNIAQRISGIANLALFVCKAYLSPSREERQVRQLILKCAKVESIWARFAREIFAYGKIEKMDPSLIQYAEHDFLERSSDLYKSLKKNEALPPRLFPSELLAPIHTINRPQDKHFWSADYIKNHPGEENGDLSRQAMDGFARLSSNFLDCCLPDKKDKGTYYVPHHEFISATEIRSRLLKEKCRDWRQTAAQTITDKKCARSFAACRSQVKKDLTEFKSAWDKYASSHELLKEINQPYSQKDYFSKYYKELYFKSFFPKDLYMNLSGYFYGGSHVRQNEAREAGYASLKKDLREKYPHTLTGQFYLLEKRKE